MPNPELGSQLIKKVQQFARTDNGVEPTNLQALQILLKLPRSTQEVLVENAVQKTQK